MFLYVSTYMHVWKAASSYRLSARNPPVAESILRPLAGATRRRTSGAERRKAIVSYRTPIPEEINNCHIRYVYTQYKYDTTGLDRLAIAAAGWIGIFIIEC